MRNQPPKFTRQDFEFLAYECKRHYEYIQYEVDEQKIDQYTAEYLMFMHWKFVQFFSKNLSATNGLFDRSKFLRAATPKDLQEKYYLAVIPQPRKEDSNG